MKYCIILHHLFNFFVQIDLATCWNLQVTRLEDLVAILEVYAFFLLNSFSPKSYPFWICISLLGVATRSPARLVQESGFDQHVLLLLRPHRIAWGDPDLWGVPWLTGARLPVHLFPHHHRDTGLIGSTAV